VQRENVIAFSARIEQNGYSCAGRRSFQLSDCTTESETCIECFRTHMHRTSADTQILPIHLRQLVRCIVQSQSPMSRSFTLSCVQKTSHDSHQSAFSLRNLLISAFYDIRLHGFFTLIIASVHVALLASYCCQTGWLMTSPSRPRSSALYEKWT